MPGIFDDERRGSGPIAPDPRGTGHCARSPRDGANSRQVRVADGSWGHHPTAPPAPNPGGNSLPPNVSIIPFQTLGARSDMLMRRRRRRITLHLLVPAGVVLFVLWIIGLLWFATVLPREVGQAKRQTDAIVVLTGGSARLSQGLDLLAEQRARKLFISGVYRGVDMAELFRVRQQSPDEFACCVILGHDADDTRGNAMETAAWIREQGFGSLRLVTANYHMPRSLLEFRHAMPDIEIVPHPVFPENFKQDEWWLWPGSASLVASEYSKYLIAFLRTTVAGRAE